MCSPGLDVESTLSILRYAPRDTSLLEDYMTEEGLAEHISTYLLCSKADKTAEKYNSCYKKFKTFCAEHGYGYLPANPILVTIFFSHLLDQNVSYKFIS